MTSVYLTFFTSYTTYLFRHKYLILYLKNLSCFDAGTAANYEYRATKTYFIISAASFISFFLDVTSFIVDDLFDALIAIERIQYNFTIHGVYVISLEFIICAEMITKRFQYLQERKLSPLSRIKKNVHLLEAVRSLNRYHDVPLLAMSGLTFFFSISQLNLIVTACILDIDDFSFDLFVITDIMRLVPCWIVFGVTALEARLLSTEAERFQQSLYDTVLNDSTNYYIDHPLVRIHMVFWEPVKINAANFFNVDLTLLCTMLGGACSYFIILVQYLIIKTPEIISFYHGNELTMDGELMDD
ncbi:Hypothetical protein NTJ_15882 [Nesidiocoris tenuis]|uniref:Gustatory receptor n=1 Tax=Nesidiocoris tenuis TaxID=355587 RepID=A0ABN7BFB1_9HEMI|nr:Hypothetical protein NTJ_15882 [Nesidiocoris tenuis]